MDWIASSIKDSRRRDHRWSKVAIDHGAEGRVATWPASSETHSPYHHNKAIIMDETASNLKFNYIHLDRVYPGEKNGRVASGIYSIDLFLLRSKLRDRGRDINS